MQNFILEEVVTSPAIPLVISVLATVVLFILVRLAMHLYRSGDFAVSAKRLAEIDPKVVRLDLFVENLEGKEKTMNAVFLGCKVGKEMKKVSALTILPIQRVGSGSFIQKSEDGYGFFAKKGSRNEVVIEFNLSAPVYDAYLCFTDDKGKVLAAHMNLGSFHTQRLRFHRA